MSLQVFLARELGFTAERTNYLKGTGFSPAIMGISTADNEKDFTLRTNRHMLNEELVQLIRRYYETRGYEVEIDETAYWGLYFTARKGKQQLKGTVSNYSNRKDVNEIYFIVSSG